MGGRGEKKKGEYPREKTKGCGKKEGKNFKVKGPSFSGPPNPVKWGDKTFLRLPPPKKIPIPSWQGKNQIQAPIQFPLVTKGFQISKNPKFPKGPKIRGNFPNLPPS